MEDITITSCIVNAIDAFYKIEEVEDLLKIAIEQGDIPIRGDYNPKEEFERILRLLRLYMNEREKPFNQLRESLHTLYEQKPLILR